MGKATVEYDDKQFDIDLVSKTGYKEASKFSKIFRTSQDFADFLVKLLIAR